MQTSYARRLEDAGDLAGIFAVVKDVVEDHLDRSRAGIMVGLTSLGFGPRGYVGGYFVTGTNAIVLNRDLLNYVRAKAPEHVDAYAFQLLLHEYLHTLGFLAETQVRPLAHELCRRALDDDHPATRFAQAMLPGADAAAAPDFVRELIMPRFGWRPTSPGELEIVRGVDPDASPYIQ